MIRHTLTDFVGHDVNTNQYPDKQSVRLCGTKKSWMGLHVSGLYSRIYTGLQQLVRGHELGYVLQFAGHGIEQVWSSVASNIVLELNLGRA